MDWLAAAAWRVGGLGAAFLPARSWARLDSRLDVHRMAFPSGLITFFIGMAIGVPGFIAHATRNASVGNTLMLHLAGEQVAGRLTRGQPEVTTAFTQGVTALSFFTFTLLTPLGWITDYLVISGTVRGLAGYFDDPAGDPALAMADALFRTLRRAHLERRARTHAFDARGPEIADRVVTGAAAGLPDAEIVIVASRAKDGWTRGTVVFTDEGRHYRVGTPVDRIINGRLRTLYPLTEHRDHEVIRRSVAYTMPAGIDRRT